jgi:triosephosphate isomerase (TIM)
MRKTIIAGNWKMNKDPKEAQELSMKIKESYTHSNNVEAILCPSAVCLDKVGEIVAGTEIKLGAQNMYYENSGAFTGENSPLMIKAVGCTHVILGHSERREYFKESDALINKKVLSAFQNNLIPIICVGETLEQREAGTAFDVVGKQLQGCLENIQAKDEFIVAYEPIWAIGTGKVATPEQAQEVHAFIRAELTKYFGVDKAETICIQYGGSVKPSNIKELINQKDIDGALVGGASLDAESYINLINNCKIS